jgi:hypothetical protein
MREGPDVLANVCAEVDAGRANAAAVILAEEYPFVPLANVGRRYSPTQSTRLFWRDGFIDRYTGKRLVFPGTLRMLSYLFPEQFPFHNNWKTDVCHFGYYELFPTIDHLVPVSRGGEDNDQNWVSTSMLKNAAKANFTIEELGWPVFPAGDIRDWDGLTGWFMRRFADETSAVDSPYLRQWAVAAKRTLSA